MTSSLTVELTNEQHALRDTKREFAQSELALGVTEWYPITMRPVC
jgi:hypothetical protein